MGLIAASNSFELCDEIFLGCKSFSRARIDLWMLTRREVIGLSEIILSGKGFDSSFAGCASPIFEDGPLVSLPIPEYFKGLPLPACRVTFADIGGVQNISALVEDLTLRLGCPVMPILIPTSGRSRFHANLDGAHCWPITRCPASSRKALC